MSLKGLKIQINENGVNGIVPETINDIGCTHQNAIVILTTMKGTDKMFPDKGTNLLLAGLRNEMFNPVATQHVANFAALDTIVFCNKHINPTYGSLALLSLRLLVSNLATGYVRFTATLGFVNGETITDYHNIT